MTEVHKLMKNLPTDMQPYEKGLKAGVEALSDVELLAVILKNGCQGMNSLEMSEQILKLPNGECSLLSLYQKSLSDLMKYAGVGKIKALTIKCIAELSVRISKASMPEQIIVNSPRVLADYYMEQLRHLSYEQLLVAFLNGSSRLLGECSISKGTINQTLVSTREIFMQAREFHAVYMILLHNHPGGDPKPSRQDIQITKKIKDAGEIMDIKLIDHIVIGDNCYMSFQEAGLI